MRDLSGQRFGRLTVIGPGEPARYACGSFPRWLCRCDCGTEKHVHGRHLLGGRIVSCGCFSRERATKHGQARQGHRSPEYVIWVEMKQRCNNPSSARYSDYGGRGIKICERWAESFETFLADMGPRPTSAHSIDRTNNDGDYEPGNCRWATRTQQARNTRWNRHLTHDGETLTYAEWAQRLGLKENTLVCRLRRGWAIADALGLPPDKNHRRPRTRRAAGFECEEVGA